MKRKPIIGIVLDYLSDSVKYSYAPRPWYALRCDYPKIVASTGATAIMIPYNDDINSTLNLIDGLIIPGGDEDIHPKFYGEEISYHKMKTNNTRAKFELSITKAALDLNMPLLGICNGMQVINTVLGGALIQHIPDYHNSEINHEQPPPKDKPTHSVIIKESTILSSLSTTNEIMVNSTHHQAIEKLGSGLVVSGVAPDGIIEAVESTKHKFVLGVQWHAEYLNSDLDKKLFAKMFEESCLYAINSK
ncbi:MAG TPA: gamma-glutamyl-gamma-aminobutyrate hydrolase family protein [Candidatus Megaira endosymbiont of Nemacystus decipiens]|nr:gamma-glutamyl-gamma-aminobutyrate hydrolase family protein [Candidatus Megaera endosymbiont of Nemacystus decipiens]